MIESLKKWFKRLVGIAMVVAGIGFLVIDSGNDSTSWFLILVGVVLLCGGWIGGGDGGGWGDDLDSDGGD